MNKLMLGAAAVALTLAVSPAFAADDSGVKLGLGGYFKGYVNYSTADDARSVDFLRDTEVHFGGETTLDNGLTVGAHIEAGADGADGFEVDESYVYFAGSWGRVNGGKEDGAAYLLQVAAPSADDNIDGIRQFVNPTSFASADYAADTSRTGDKITYLSPVFSGFQAGVSYTPDIDSNAGALTGNRTAIGDESATEGAVRYEGMLGSVGLIAGAGYTATTQGADEWNAGVDLDIGAFGVGAVYKDINGDASSALASDVTTWALGADYTTGPFKLGVSYLNQDDDTTANVVSDRYAAGVVYSYGPGMTFRGSVNYTEADNVTLSDDDATTVSVGTQINF